MNLLSNLKKIRVQHVDRDAKGVEIKTDVDVITDADCITMDDGDLRSGVKKMIDDRIGEVIDGAPEELDTLKEIATELEENQSGVSTIIKTMNDKLEAKDLKDYAKTVDVDDKLKSKVEAVNGKGLSTNDFTDVDKQKLDNIEAGAQKNTVTSVNGMTGAVTIEAGSGNVDLSGYAKTSDIKTKLSEMTDDTNHRTVTDEEKKKWNDKAIELDKSGIGEARIKKLINCMADPDYLFSNKTDLYKDLNDIYGLNMSNSITDISKLRDYDEEANKLYDNIEALTSLLKSRYFYYFIDELGEHANVVARQRLFHHSVFNALINNTKAWWYIVNKRPEVTRDLMYDVIDCDAAAYAFTNNKTAISIILQKTKNPIPLQGLIKVFERFIGYDAWSYVWSSSFCFALADNPYIINEVISCILSTMGGEKLYDFIDTLMSSNILSKRPLCLYYLFQSVFATEVIIRDSSLTGYLRTDWLSNNNFQQAKDIVYNTVKKSTKLKKTVIIENDLNVLNEKCKNGSVIFIEVLNNNNTKVKVKHDGDMTAFIDSGFRDFSKDNRQEIVNLSGVSFSGCTFEANGDAKVLCEIYTFG